MKSVRCLALFLSAALAGGTLWAQEKVSFVNPIIGTNGMGHTFPVRRAPFGIVQVSPDTDTILTTSTVSINLACMNTVQATNIRTVPSSASAIRISVEQDIPTSAISC